MSAMQIDYDALAEALVRRGFSSLEGVGGRGGEPSGGSPGVLGGFVSVGVESVGGDVGRLAHDAPVVAGSVVESESVGAVSGVGVGSEFELAGESVESEGSLSGGEPGVVSDKVRGEVKFGGMADVVVESSQESRGKGFFASVIRSDEVKALRSCLEAAVGARLPKAASRDLAVCTYTAGTMPVSLVKGKDRLSGLALVGDSAMDMHVYVYCLNEGMTKEEASVLRSRVTSDSNLRRIAVECGWHQHVRYPPGVSPGDSKPTATFVEALVGVVVMWRDPAVVSRLLRFLKLF